MAREQTTGVILCAGRGARLGDLTAGRPKCLLPLAGRTILEWSLMNLRAAGIGDVVLVTGFRRDLIEEFLAERAEAGVTCVQNDRYATTNTAVSFNLALRVLDMDILLANVDVLYDPAILEDLVRHPVANCVAVDTDVHLEAEEVKVVVRDGRVAEIGKDIDPGRCQGEAIGLYKVGRGLIGDLRRIYDDQPFADVIKSSPTRSSERDVAPHPSLKPQAFMRQIVRAALPLGEGIILDPFMGGGSTIAAACAVGYHSIGIESDAEFYRMAVRAIPRLAALGVNENGNEISNRNVAVQTSLFAE